uniref:RIKEN cDNA 4930451I11 gene n=1 Tax=Mus spicilegus TaxID=10103 RepID=A0A8C6N3A6_MUSSI
MKLWLWVAVGVWMLMAELGTIETAPRRDGTRPSVSGARPQPVVNRLFFDYPDSDRASLLAVARFIGEKPITFVKTDSSPGLFQNILVGTLVVAFFFLLFQFCLHVNFQKGA